MPFVQVTLLAGRTREQKHALIRSLSDAVATTLDTPVDRVRVALYEVSADEWGIGGQAYAQVRGPAAVVPAVAGDHEDTREDTREDTHEDTHEEDP